MEAEVLYCICRQPYDKSLLMIQCDYCQDWFHTSCVKLADHQARDLEKYHCPNCEGVRGASLYRQRTNWHRRDYWEPDAENKPVQTGTAIFIKELKIRHFPTCETVVKVMKGQQITVPYLHQHGFDTPIICLEKEGLEIKVPEMPFGVKDVQNFVGPEFVLDVIDVARQVNIKMVMSDFVKYFDNKKDHVTTLNAISLEFSLTSMDKLVDAPQVARQLDWVSYVWPQDTPEDRINKPQVQKYCLMSMKDSFTDFHIDFGGSSVWYHVLWGEKIFYLIKPTPANLSLYQRWQFSATNSEDFFGDQVDMCFKCVLSAGQTMLIPTGWIHAVFTPVDTLVFGGNFLHSLNIPLQLQIYEIEMKIGEESKFLFPNFEAINWYAAYKLLDELKTTNSMNHKSLSPFLLLGIKALTYTLKQWLNDRDVKRKKHDVPEAVHPYELCKDLNKEIRKMERILNLLNPPKPERESKRRKKKPMNKDFVEYNYSDESARYDEKHPLKITIKMESVSTAPANPPAAAAAAKPARPLPKLTLPKPATYPYTTQAASPDAAQGTQPEQDSSPVLAENRDKASRRQWSLVKPLDEAGCDENSVNGSQGSYSQGTKMCFKKVGAQDAETKLSVYDYNSEEEDRLTIDDAPKSKRRRYSVTTTGSLKIKLPNPRYMANLSAGALEAMSEDIGGEVDVVSEVLPKNGIEELLRASGYPTGPAATTHLPGIDDMESRRASPSTIDAIDGMLSISGSSFLADQAAKADATGFPRSPRHKKIRFLDDYGENMNKVHQDDDYVYPSLDVSDEEEEVFKPRGKRKMDESWNPKARVGPLVPKTNRPMREGTKKQAVEKGLEAAALKRAGQPPAKRPYNRKKVKVPQPPPPAVVMDLPESPPTASTSGTSASTTPVSPASKKKKIDLKSRKPRKGMATAKQRLGKILKIGKMKY